MIVDFRLMFVDCCCVLFGCYLLIGVRVLRFVVCCCSLSMLVVCCVCLPFLVCCVFRCALLFAVVW